MFNLYDITKKNNKEHNEKWPYIPDHPCRILIIVVLEQKKTSVLLNLKNEQNDIGKIICMQKI